MYLEKWPHYQDGMLSTEHSKWGVLAARSNKGTVGRQFIGMNTNAATIEFWYLTENLTDWQAVFELAPVNSGFSFMVGATQFAIKNNNTELYSPRVTHGFVTNQWYHIAIVFDSGTMRLYIDGVKVGDNTMSGGQQDWAQIYLLNSTVWDAPNYNDQAAWLSDLRITNAVRYDADFTPPSGPLTLAGDTLAPDVMCLTSFDEQTDLHQVEDQITGNPQWYTGASVRMSSDSKFGTQAVTNTTSRISRDFGTKFGLSDFTIEFWAKIPSSAGSSYPSLIHINDGPTDEENQQLLFQRNGSNLYLWLLDGGNWITPGNVGFTPEIWFHVALVRQSGNFMLFIDGDKKFEDTSNTSYNISHSTVHLMNSIQWTRDYRGLLDDFVITMGVAKYTSNFTPSSTAYDYDTDPNKSSVVSYLNFEQDFVPADFVTPEDQVEIPIVFDQIPTLPDTVLGVFDFPTLRPTQMSQGIKPEYPLSTARTRQLWRTLSTDETDIYDRDLHIPERADSFIQGTTIRDSQPQADIYVDLIDKFSTDLVERQTTQDSGEYVFHGLKRERNAYRVVATPRFDINHNAVVFDRVTATQYDITTSGRFTRNTVESKVDSSVHIDNGFGPFSVSLESGTLPPGVTPVVEGRDIKLDGPTTFFDDEYIFSLKISGDLNYSPPKIIEYELTDASVNSIGSILEYDSNSLEIDVRVKMGYERVVNNLSPLAFLPLNELTGTTATDISGNSHHGTWHGNPTLGVDTITLSISKSAKFNSTGWISVDGLAPALVGKSFTIVAWGMNPGKCMWGINTSSGGNILMAFADGGSKVRFHVEPAGSVLDKSYGWGNNPHCIALSYDYSTKKLNVYVDGSPFDNTTSTVTIGNTDVFSIGQEFDNATTTDMWEGTQGAFAAFDRVLTPEEIASLYESGS